MRKYLSITILLCGILIVNLLCSAVNVHSIFAAEQNSFVVIQKGDLDKNGTITLSDAKKALVLALGIEKPTEEEKTIADLYNNGQITLDNATLILQAALGIIDLQSVLPTEEPTDTPEPVKTPEPIATPVPTATPNFEEKTVYADIYEAVILDFMWEADYERVLGLRKDNLINATENDCIIIEYNLKQRYSNTEIYWDYENYQAVLDKAGHNNVECIDIRYINWVSDEKVELCLDYNYDWFGFGGTYTCTVEKIDGVWEVYDVKCIVAA